MVKSQNYLELVLSSFNCLPSGSVSYTHLDVYKRQGHERGSPLNGFAVGRVAQKVVQNPLRFGQLLVDKRLVVHNVKIRQ